MVGKWLTQALEWFLFQKHLSLAKSVNRLTEMLNSSRKIVHEDVKQLKQTVH